MLFEHEIYYQANLVVEKKLEQRRLNAKHRGRPMPGIVQPSERVVLPASLSAYQSLALFTVALHCYYDNDLVLSEIFNSILGMARVHRYEGKWKIFLEWAVINGCESDHPIGNIFNDEQPFPEAFAIPEYYEFIQTKMSTEEIFGNLIRVGINCICACKTRTRFDSELTSPVRRPQRKRGYTDKGTLPEYDAEARQLANIYSTERFNLKFDSINQIHVLPKSEDDEGSGS